MCTFKIRYPVPHVTERIGPNKRCYLKVGLISKNIKRWDFNKIKTRCDYCYNSFNRGKRAKGKQQGGKRRGVQCASI